MALLLFQSLIARHNYIVWVCLVRFVSVLFFFLPNNEGYNQDRCDFIDVCTFYLFSFITEKYGHNYGRMDLRLNQPQVIYICTTYECVTFSYFRMILKPNSMSYLNDYEMRNLNIAKIFKLHSFSHSRMRLHYSKCVERCNKVFEPNGYKENHALNIVDFASRMLDICWNASQRTKQNVTTENMKDHKKNVIIHFKLKCRRINLDVRSCTVVCGFNIDNRMKKNWNEKKKRRRTLLDIKLSDQNRLYIHIQFVLHLNMIGHICVLSIACLCASRIHAKVFLAYAR